VLRNAHLGPVPHGPAGPVGIGSFNALQVELCRLSEDATLAGLLDGVSLPALPLPPIVQDTGLRFGFESSRLSWTTVTVSPGPGIPAVPTAALHMDLPLELRDVDLADFADLLFDIDGYTLPVTVDIAAIPCGDCTDPAVNCTDAPGAIATGYRTGIATALGYASGDVDATYGDVGLNLRVITGPPPPPMGTRLAGVTGGTSFTAACPFAIGDLNTLELFRALDIDAFGEDSPELRDLRWLSIVINIARGLFAPLRYLLGVIVCEVATDLIDGVVRDRIGTVPSSLQSMFNTLVNPPVLNRTLAGLGALGLPLPAGTAAGDLVARAGQSIQHTLVAFSVAHAG